MIDFKVYESTTLTDLGTLAKVAGKGGKLKFIAKNLANDEKRVAVVVNKADGTSAVIPCSNTVSKGVRQALESSVEKNKILATLAKLSVMEGEEEHPFIVAPITAGGTEEEFTIEQLAVVKNATYEDVIGY